MLRYEIKAKEMAFFKDKKIEIRSLEDLKNHRNLEDLRTRLRSTLEEIIMVDPYHERILTIQEERLMSKFANPHEWKRIIPNAQNFPLRGSDPGYHRERKQYYRERNQFFEIVDKYDLSKLKKKLLASIKQKFMEDRLDVPGTNSDVTIS